MPMSIREATADDIADLATLLVEVNDLHASALPHIYRRVAADDQTASFLRSLLEEEETRLLVAEEAGQLVGYVALRLSQAPNTPVHVPRRWVIIDAVVVREAFRRRGIGEALMEHAHAWAVEQDIGEVELEVAEFNAAAIALYQKLGYTTVSRRMTRALADGARNEGAGE